MFFIQHNAFYEPKTGFYKPNKGFYKPKTGFYKPKTGFHKPKTGFYKPKTGFYKPKTGFYKPNKGCYKPNKGFYKPKKGCYKPNKGCYKPNKGFYKPKKGCYKPNKGFHKPKKGFHKPKKGCYKPNKGFYKPNKGFYKPKKGFHKPKKGIRKVEGFIRKGLKRRRHTILRMEENKLACAKCKKSLDIELFDGFKHCRVCREKRRVYRKQFYEIHKDEINRKKREKTAQNGAFICKCGQRIKPENYERHKEGRAHISQINEFIRYRESCIRRKMEDYNYISNLPDEIKGNHEQIRLHIIRKYWHLDAIRNSFED